MSSVPREAEYFSQPHVHTWDDGRGQRLVLIDGVNIQYATFADTELGIVVAEHQPLRVMPGTDLIDQYVVMGAVCVEQAVS